MNIAVQCLNSNVKMARRRRVSDEKAKTENGHWNVVSESKK